MSGVQDSLISTGFGLGWSAVRRMPERAAYATFERIADTLWARRGSDVLRLESNLRRVVGPEPSEEELRVLSRAGMRSYFRYWCDAFRLPGWSRERIVDSIRVIDDHRLGDALASGRGAITVLPHMGNWDHAGAWATLAHAPVVTVAERLKPEDLYEKFLAFRRSLGMDVIPLTGGDPPFPYLADKLREGGLVALLGDRDLGRSGVPVQFFGEKAKFPAGPAALAVDTGAVLLPVTLWWEDGHNWLRFHPPVEVPEEGERSRRIFRTTQLVADAFAEGIAARPADWHMLQRLWVADLDPSKAPARDADS
jgi:KDO2-lipid IV(A) lauroyltransferase